MSGWIKSTFTIYDTFTKGKILAFITPKIYIHHKTDFHETLCPCQHHIRPTTSVSCQPQCVAIHYQQLNITLGLLHQSCQPQFVAIY